MLFLDGELRGITPLRIELEEGRSYDARLERRGYLPVETKISAAEYQHFHYELVMTKEGLAGQTDWISVKIQTGGGAMSYYPVGAAVQLATLKWRRLFWTLAEGGASVLNVDDDNYYWAVGTRIRNPLAMDSTGRHRVSLGIGVGFWKIRQRENGGEDAGRIAFEGFYLSPNLCYTFQFSDRFSVGLDFQAMLPAVGLDNLGDYAWALFLSVPVAWSM